MGGIYCYIVTYPRPSARTDRLIPIWKQLSDSRFQMAVSREEEHPPYSRLQTAVLWGFKCLSHTYSVHSRPTAAYKQPSHSIYNRLTATCQWRPGRVKNICLTPIPEQLSQPFPNSCLVVNSSKSNPAGGTILAMYYDSNYLFITMQMSTVSHGNTIHRAP